ncbi:hypothetical protein KCU89_g69, partial [Aureobasidium melanogenum]
MTIKTVSRVFSWLQDFVGRKATVSKSLVILRTEALLIYLRRSGVRHDLVDRLRPRLDSILKSALGQGPCVRTCKKDSTAARFQVWMYKAFTPRGGLFAILTSLGMLGLSTLTGTVTAGLLALLTIVLPRNFRRYTAGCMPEDTNSTDKSRAPSSFLPRTQSVITPQLVNKLLWTVSRSSLERRSNEICFSECHPRTVETQRQHAVTARLKLKLQSSFDLHGKIECRLAVILDHGEISLRYLTMATKPQADPTSRMLAIRRGTGD